MDVHLAVSLLVLLHDGFMNVLGFMNVSSPSVFLARYYYDTTFCSCFYSSAGQVTVVWQRGWWRELSLWLPLLIKHSLQARAHLHRWEIFPHQCTIHTRSEHKQPPYSDFLFITLPFKRLGSARCFWNKFLCSPRLYLIKNEWKTVILWNIITFIPVNF